MDHGSHVVNNCHLYPLKPFISQGLQVSEVICCFIAVGGNNFNLVLEDKKDISIFLVHMILLAGVCQCSEVSEMKMIAI